MASSSQSTGIPSLDSSRNCCRCNHSGRCRNCSCCKQNRLCFNCLPSRLGKCENYGTTFTVSTENLPSSDVVTTVSTQSAHSAESTIVDTATTDIPSSSEVRPLPPFDSMSTPSFVWGEVDGDSFLHSVACCYDEVIHWRKILFRLPSGKSGRAFVSELCRLFHAYATGSALECVAMKAIMIMPVLLLQRPHHRSKNDDNISHLNRRLCLWNKGDIDGLVSEGRVLQRVLSSSKPSRMGKSSLKDNIARKFSNLMMCGRVKDALRLLSKDNCGGLLPMSSSVMNALKTKHPKKQAPVPSTLVGEPYVSVPPPHPIVFDQFVLKTSGAAGPSGLDAAAWRRICTSFQRASSDLCDALSAVARRLCATFVDPAGLSAFVSCRLIALDKCPGVRPIGVGETVRRIIAKAVLSVIKEDIREAAGSSQLCAGQLSGCEAAVHSVRTLFGSPDTEAAMLVSASLSIILHYFD